MIILSDFLTLAPYKKRKLKNGEWIIVSRSGNPLVIDRNTLNLLKKGKVNNDLLDSLFITMLNDGGFLEGTSGNIKIPVEPHSALFRFFSIFVLLAGFISFFMVILFLYLNGLPFKSSIIFLIENPLTGLAQLIVFTTLSTGLHEIMHLIFSNRLFSKEKELNLCFKKAVATISMTHVWTWSLLGRMAAILSGICLDLCILLLLLFFPMIGVNFEVILLFQGVLITRIAWQFRVYSITDIRLTLNMIRDDPFLFDNKTCRSKLILALGMGADIFILLVWLIPTINYFRT
ncbi:hypothetical protein Q1I10_000457 [Enterococcus faecium]|nr:hypothetical protein [Enterococcus faecium]